MRRERRSVLRAGIARQFALLRLLYPALAISVLYRLLGIHLDKVQPADAACDHLKEDFTVRAASTAAAVLKPFLNDLVALCVHHPCWATWRLAYSPGRSRIGKEGAFVQPSSSASKNSCL
ncbi:hypothetical protein ACE3MQ_26080 [Paenibacillus lentus]|uniref:hypothetical protein n=1 Tax=Paenibacillus lentus TaxID=1338368 RepID=UPI003657110C